MEQKLTYRARFDTESFSVGYTVEKTYYCVEELAKTVVDFQHDDNTISIINDDAIVKINYDNLAFVNISQKQGANAKHGQHVVVGFFHAPYVQERNRNSRDDDVHDRIRAAFHYGTAFEFTPNKATKDLVYMLKLQKINVTDNRQFGLEKNPHNFEEANFGTYEGACVETLGYPGLFLRELYTDQYKPSEQLYNNIFYHVSTDRHLNSMHFEQYFQQDPENENYVKIKSISVTPSGYNLRPPTWKNSNYVIRKFDPTGEKIMVVNFSDNDGRNMTKPETIQETVLPACRDGIAVCGQLYNYFLASGSKFREHSHFFYQGSKAEIQRIWGRMGNYEEALPAKIGARVGQNSSSVRIGVTLTNFMVMHDIKSLDGMYNFTDGCGLMTSEFAEKLRKKLFIKYVPSAFQIRFPGFKGVLLVTSQPLKGADGRPLDVCFTQEMMKFVGDTKQATLDVIKFSSPIPLNLNKNLMEVLCQNAAKHGQDCENRMRDRINQMGRAAVMDLIDKCVVPEKFMKTLDELPKYMDYRKMQGFTKSELLSEPFLRSLVHTDSVVLMNKLHEKQQIPIHYSKGRNLFGVPDFWKLLKPNQVYIRYSENLKSSCKSKKVLQQTVAVTRSPLYHLGGIQFVQAVDVPQLTELGICDVIVFPTTGDIPLQEMMAGGDLDGDEYSVFWDPELMLPGSQGLVQTTSQIADRAQMIGLDQLHTRYPQFIVEYMSTPAVGTYANNHLLKAEYFKYDNPHVLQIAEKNEHALLYFKSGIPPADLTVHEKSSHSPAHMRNVRNPMYRVDSVLSDNHDYFQEHSEDINSVFKNDLKKPYIDPKIVTPGWEQHKKLAQKTYNEFRNQITVIQVQYSIQKMAELFSGRIAELQKRPVLKTENDPVTSLPGLIQNLVNNIWKSFRQNFLDACVPGWRQQMLDQNCDVFTFYCANPPEKLQQYAVAFYKHAYEDGACLAFPWILWDVLDHVRRQENAKKGDSLFELGVFDGGNPRQNLSQFLQRIIFNCVDPLKKGIYTEFFGLLYHLRLHTQMQVSDAVFDNLIDGFRTTFLDPELDANHHQQQQQQKVEQVNWYEKRLNFVTKFIKNMGFVQENVDPNVKKICRNLYLKMAFQQNPQGFLDNYREETTEKLQKFVVKMTVELTDKMVSNLATKTGCQIVFRGFNDNSGDVAAKKYWLFALGNTRNLKKLRDFLTIVIPRATPGTRTISFNDWSDHLTRLQTAKMNTLK